MPAPSVPNALDPADGAIQLKEIALLAGRKLLIADDSATIQKVIDLTFADEGVRVVAFDNGQDAIDQLEEVAPDIVLADVLMPIKSGYEVCEHIKQNEKLKHIPVMLLVGSFEPFDEAEARRVGADDILTKPFQSIRRLIDRVGALVGTQPSERDVPTAELPGVEPAPADVEARSTGELEITTADTQPLPEKAWYEKAVPDLPASATESVVGEEEMATADSDLSEEPQVDKADVLLDLGEFEPRPVAVSDDFVLDLEDTLPGVFGGPEPAEAQPSRASVEPQISETVVAVAAQEFGFQVETEPVLPSFEAGEVAYEDQVHQVVSPVDMEAVRAVEGVGFSSESMPGKLSPEMIDIIARRAVEMLSEKVIREIAWEVVPELAELLIKRQLEERESQPK